MNAPGGWELILLVLALVAVGSLVYGFVWAVRRLTGGGSNSSRRSDDHLIALRARVDEVERRLDEQLGPSN